ncbi:malonyl-CoA O-methyltransferase [Polynucleobacter meluiroseus]|uniref:Malonyl-CoA O-methyltransferase n=1 Tax=Polynucleobacter meluiroseus TaxID=1938814 RepID=A0A240DZX4_9BURK|nr:methyltransferase domain-containing protein [Polynucleobacter meluiroseus]SNX27811.1 malonyl-CoA O-methyltransferase [Polynucleobacter meluiroseus]
MTQPIRWLQDEIADRMLQKLDLVKLPVKSALIVPDFPGDHCRFLTKRFPGVRIVSAPESDLRGFDLLRLKTANLWHSGLKSQADISLEEFQKSGRFDLPDHSVDLVFSDLLIQNLADPKAFLQECWRILKEGGLLTFSYLGPDTGKELYAAASPKWSLKKLASPWDMHDMGDALVGARFADPVMDMEYLNLEYESSAVLQTDAVALNLMEPLAEKLPISSEMPSKLTLEVVYGHAWAIGKHLAKPQDHIAYIDPSQILRKTRITPEIK